MLRWPAGPTAGRRPGLAPPASNGLRGTACSSVCTHAWCAAAQRAATCLAIAGTLTALTARAGAMQLYAYASPEGFAAAAEANSQLREAAGGRPLGVEHLRRRGEGVTAARIGR